MLPKTAFILQIIKEKTPPKKEKKKPFSIQLQVHLYASQVLQSHLPIPAKWEETFSVACNKWNRWWHNFLPSVRMLHIVHLNCIKIHKINYNFSYTLPVFLFNLKLIEIQLILLCSS